MMNEFKEFMKNETMKQEYTAFIEEKKPETLDALAQTVVDFAASKGFSISKEEVLNSIPDEMKSGKTELSDDMLDAVVGGSSLWSKIKGLASDIADAAKSLFGDDDNVTPVDNTTTTMVCSSCGYTPADIQRSGEESFPGRHLIVRYAETIPLRVDKKRQILCDAKKVLRIGIGYDIMHKVLKSTSIS